MRRCLRTQCLRLVLRRHVFVVLYRWIPVKVSILKAGASFRNTSHWCLKHLSKLADLIQPLWRKKQKKKWNSKKHIEDNKFCYLKNRFRHFFNMNSLPAIRFDIKYKYCYPSIYICKFYYPFLSNTLTERSPTLWHTFF